MKKLTKIIALIVLAVGAWSCSNDDDPNGKKTIAGLAASTADLSILKDALDRTNLTATLNGNTDYTVFAPTNAAFTAFLQQNGFSSLDDVPVDVLTQVLLNHVVAGKVTSGQLTTGYVKTLATGSASSTNTLSMFVNTSSGVVLNGGAANGGASVTTADIEASNGVVHIVGSVIGLPTVASHAVANPDFSVLVQALTRPDQPDFVGILSGTANAPFTVFAPGNTAFVNLLGELGLSGLNDIPQATLEKTLKYHVVTGANVLSGNLTNGVMVNTFAGDPFTVNLSGGASITDANGRVSNITYTDVQASNGVIHVIDKVLLPNL